MLLGIEPTAQWIVRASPRRSCNEIKAVEGSRSLKSSKTDTRGEKKTQLPPLLCIYLTSVLGAVGPTCDSLSAMRLDRRRLELWGRLAFLRSPLRK
ncbi:hypothetical protein GWI33_005447 [Rhynchophorus ferrugineus]|uniref:Uncharacterized protein n=1 Tax=Rhynchophorus ferrugineus TaxID=354439 RepID=A0A834IGP6_RHYFE|nr:hypothetical protein GWI33_005447 [Rhynchophorus ferrugineus]